MKFSTIFNITRDLDDKWFDPILKRDTKLFIDPFLLFKAEDELFGKSYDNTISFFNKA